MYFADYLGQRKLLLKMIDRMNGFNDARGMPLIDPAIPLRRLMKSIKKHYGRTSKYKGDGTLDPELFIGKSYPGQWMDR